MNVLTLNYRFVLDSCATVLIGGGAGGRLVAQHPCNEAITRGLRRKKEEEDEEDEGGRGGRGKREETCLTVSTCAPCRLGTRRKRREKKKKKRRGGKGRGKAIGRGVSKGWDSIEGSAAREREREGEENYKKKHI